MAEKAIEYFWQLEYRENVIPTAASGKDDLFVLVVKQDGIGRVCDVSFGERLKMVKWLDKMNPSEIPNIKVFDRGSFSPFASYLSEKQREILAREVFCLPTK